jgi:ABC-type Fe3+/spermidine/putrescine transport system ATPase subunit
VQIGAPEEIFHRPTSAFVAGFMGADNSLDVSRGGDGALQAVGLDTTPDQRIASIFAATQHVSLPAASATSNVPGGAGTVSNTLTKAGESGDLVLTGVVAQSVYVGQGYRYRVRTDDADIWVHASERVAEGTPTCVVVPRDALLLFSQPSTT